MQERIDRIRRQRELEERKQQLDKQRKASEEEAREQLRKDEILKTPEHQALLDFARSSEVEAMMREIWDFACAKLLSVREQNKIFPTVRRQIPFELKVQSGTQSVIVGFEFLRISEKWPYNEIVQREFSLIIEYDQNGNIGFQVGRTFDNGYMPVFEPQILTSAESYLMHFAWEYENNESFRKKFK